jgi:hypothetical protein
LVELVLLVFPMYTNLRRSAVLVRVLK